MGSKVAKVVSIIALDPGNENSAFVRWDGDKIIAKMYAPNPTVLNMLVSYSEVGRDTLYIEKVASYGMPVGESIFETVYWSGRFAQAFGAARVVRMPRMEVKMHLCHNSRAKDGNIRQALIDRFGVVGVKRNPGPFYGVSGDLWAATALAVTAWDKEDAHMALRE